MRRLQAASAQVQGTGAKFKTWAKGVSTSMLTAFGPQLAIDFLQSAIKGASDLNETLNKSTVVFGRQAASVEEWSKTASTSFGLSQRAALDAASTFGDMF